jgi:DeoR/GlpR family transcriptional regulator of sugar metabolism
MLKKERQAHIIRQINLHNKVLSTDLSLQLNVSEDTIRRDLNELAESGAILKVHGGALSKSFHSPFQGNEVYAREAKVKIARKTLQLIQEDMVLLTGGGTTMMELIHVLPDDLSATFFTISPLIALELASHPKIEVILIGGNLSKNSHISMGSQVISFLSDIKVDMCLLGTNGISAERGLTDSDWEIVQVKKAMIRSANKPVLLSISEKLGSLQRMKVCELNQVYALVTELDPTDPSLDAYRPSLHLY